MNIEPVLLGLKQNDIEQNMGLCCRDERISKMGLEHFCILGIGSVLIGPSSKQQYNRNGTVVVKKMRENGEDCGIGKLLSLS